MTYLLLDGDLYMVPSDLSASCRPAPVARDAESPPTGRRRSVNRSGEDPAPSN